MLIVIRDTFCSITPHTIAVFLLQLIAGTFAILMINKTYRESIFHNLNQQNAVLGVTALVSTLTSLCLVLSSLNFSDGCQLARVKAAFRQKVEFKHPPCIVHETTLIMKMKRLLNQTNGVYYLLEGPYGSGKTTALLLAAEDIGNNIVYVSTENDFGMSLARKFSMCKESPPHVELVLAYLQFPMPPKCPKTLEGKVRAWEKIMEDALLEMWKEGNPAPVLIIDHIDLLLHVTDGTQILIQLQRFAKRMADKRLLTIVFVASEGKVQKMLNKQSEKSRMVTLLVDDGSWHLPREEAVRHLKCLCEFESDFEDNIFIEVLDIVGGHFTHIMTASTILTVNLASDAGVNIEKIKSDLFRKVSGDFEVLGVSKTPPPYTDKPSDDISIATWSLARKIVGTNDQIISHEEANEIIEKLPDDKKEELRRAIFEWTERYVTFQSSLFYSYFKSAFERERQTDRKTDS